MANAREGHDRAVASPVRSDFGETAVVPRRIAAPTHAVPTDAVVLAVGKRSCSALASAKPPTGLTRARSFFSLALALAIATPTIASAAPSAQQRGAYKTARADMEKAGERGDWYTFLDKAKEALNALPEAPGNEGARLEIAGYVGTWKVGERAPRQLEISITVLETYMAQLTAAYGDAAEKRPAWAKAEAFAEDLRARLPTTADPFASEGVATPPPPPPRDESERPRKPVNGVLIGGGVLTALGSSCLIASVVTGAVAVRWLQSQHDAIGECKSDLTADTCPAAAERRHGWAVATGVSISLAAIGAGLLAGGVYLLVKERRTKKTRARQARIQPDGLGFRF